MNDTPTIAQKGPYIVKVECGKTYLWCQCGLSNKQPFCDDSHGSTLFKPIKYKAEESKKVFFCGCKRSARKPFCDGAHKSL
jgi:CDGSH-type Zn-finger protein